MGFAWHRRFSSGWVEQCTDRARDPHGRDHGRDGARLRAGIEGGVQQGLPPQTGRHMISEMLTASSEVGVLNPLTVLTLAAAGVGCPCGDLILDCP
jgi:hypothetical protein